MQINSFLVKSPVRNVYGRFGSMLPLKMLRRIEGKIFVNARIIENPLVFRLLDMDVRRILDIGSYTSPIALSLSSLGFDVTTIDLKGYPFQHPNLKVVQGNFFQNNFPNGYFGAVTCISTLEHIKGSNAKKQFMQEIKRILKNEGQCLLSFPVKDPKGDFIPEKELVSLLHGFTVEKKFVFYKKQGNWTRKGNSDKLECIIIFCVLRKRD